VGVVLAGGRSVRFGDADKLSATYRGAPLLHGAVRGLAAVAPRIVVVAGAEGAAPNLPDEVPAEVIHDPEPERGPLAGLLAGLGAARAASWALVLGGDMPDPSEDVLRELLAVARSAAADAAALREGDRLRPLPCAVRTAAAAEAAAALLASGEGSLRALLARLGAAEIPEDAWTAVDPDRRTLLDVDEPGDLER